MNSSSEIILDTIIGFLIVALCAANLFNLIGYIMFEETFGFGSLNEKSSIESDFTIENEKFKAFSKQQYYMLPIVDIENTREVYKYNSDEMYVYSANNGDNLLNIYNKVEAVLNNTENAGDLDNIECYIEMNEKGTVRFIKE